jgi:antitoxin HicB
MSGEPHYSMVIQWSDEDQIYVVSLPEWGKYAQTHGSTYEDAVRNGQEVLQMLIDSA